MKNWITNFIFCLKQLNFQDFKYHQFRTWLADIYNEPLFWCGHPNEWSEIEIAELDAYERLYEQGSL